MWRSRQGAVFGRRAFMAEVLARLSSKAIAMSLSTLLLVACSSGGGGGGGGTSSTDITQWVAWGGQELKAYRDVLAPFEKDTGIKVHLTTNRESNTAIAQGISAGTELPDVAPGPSDPGQLKDWVSKGALKPMETVLEGSFNSYTSNTYPSLVTATGNAADNYVGIVNGKHYELIVKTQVKGLIWYNKKVFTGTAPKTFDELLAIKPSQYGAQKLFCAAFESGGDSGWPASDDLNNIVMRQAGDSVYKNWIQGKQKWTSPEIKSAYQSFLKMVSPANVYGGPNTVLSTNFGKAGDPLFKQPAGCLFLEQATFITNFFTQDFPSLNLKAGTDYDYFGHPSMGVSQFDGNVNFFYDNVAVYNDTPAVRKLMQYLSTSQAQQIWVNDGGTLGAIKSLTYSDPLFKTAADIELKAQNLLITAGDYMPTDMKHAYWKSLLQVTNNPNSLDSQLAYLDQVQKASYSTS
jgi:alpha-glucoside transport system substrate-binding protein